MKVKTLDGKIIELEDFPFSANTHMFLLNMQTNYPNAPVRVVGAIGRNRYLPIHKLDLESFQDINKLNI